MLGIPILWLVAGGIVLAALAGSHGWAYGEGKDAVQHEWDIDRAERAAAQATADEVQRLKGHAAALSYEQDRAARQVRIVTVTKEVNHALDADPDWSRTAVPPSVRDAIAAAYGQAASAPQPDAAMRLPAPGGADERATGTGLRFGVGRPGGLFGPASGSR